MLFYQKSKKWPRLSELGAPFFSSLFIYKKKSWLVVPFIPLFFYFEKSHLFCY